MLTNQIFTEYTHGMNDGYRLRDSDVEFAPVSACAENDQWQRLARHTIYLPWFVYLIVWKEQRKWLLYVLRRAFANQARTGVKAIF